MACWQSEGKKKRKREKKTFSHWPRKGRTTTPMQDKEREKDNTLKLAPSPASAAKHTSNPRALHSKSSRSFPSSKHSLPAATTTALHSTQFNTTTITTTTTNSNTSNSPSVIAIMHNHSHHQHNSSLDSPAYDASEEDNDPLTDSGASAVSVSDLPSRIANRQQNTNSRSRPTAARQHALASSLFSSDEAVDSPTYDGDVESSATLGPDPVVSHTSSNSRHTRYHSITTSNNNNQPGSAASTLSPTSPHLVLPHSTHPSHNHVSNAKPPPPARTNHNQSPPSLLRPTPSHPSRPTEPSPATTLPASSAPLAFDPAKLTPEDIQSWFQEVRHLSPSFISRRRRLFFSFHVPNPSILYLSS